jgi:hypothetical protein
MPSFGFTPRSPDGTRRYPRGWAVTLPEPEWVSQEDAAKQLRVNILRVGVLISNEHLDAAETVTGAMGVTEASLTREAEWRASASLAAKYRRALRDLLRWS